MQITAQNVRPFIKRRPQEGAVRERALIRGGSQRGKEYGLLATYTGGGNPVITRCRRLKIAINL